MRPFLARLAEALLDRHGGRLDRVAVVLPGKRAGLHLRKYLAEVHGGPLWSPDILHIGAFLERASGIEQGDAMDLLLQLYATYREQTPSEPDGLARFLEWAPTTLKDMSEVDAHLLDLDDLYKDLRQYHELEEWSFRLGELSPAQHRSNSQWHATGLLHRAFQERMRRERRATSGFVARACAERMAKAVPLPWEHIWFAGLNALDPATTRTIQQLQAQGRAEVAWDADRFYLDDHQQEAGRYMRRSMATLGAGSIPPQDNLLGRERNLQVAEAPHALAQVAYVAQYLAGLPATELERTAVVLGQEDLLLPLLERMPSGIGPLNVTMGIPLSTLPAYALMEAYLDLIADSTPGGLKVSMLIALLGHPFLRSSGRTDEVIAELRTLSSPRIEMDTVVAQLSGAGNPTRSTWERTLDAAGDPTKLRDGCLALFELAMACATDDPIVREQIASMADVQERLDRLMERNGHTCTSFEDYRAIRERLVREERLVLMGEPLRGLQVMGLLETRCVDHEHVVVVGMNEGVLPRSDQQTTWIPFDIRRHHGLPLPADAEAVTAYNLLRAMQWPGQVLWTISAGEGGDAGEPSRYVGQWMHEITGHSRTRSSLLRTGAPAIVRGMHPIRVEKGAEVQERLTRLCERGLSPSAIGTWLRCPLDFYFRYIAGIREKDVADGRLGSDVLGVAVHNVIERILRPLIGEPLLPHHFSAAVDLVPAWLTDELARHLPRPILEHGHYRLRREMATQAVQTYLHAEAERVAAAPDSILGIEEDVHSALSPGVYLRGRCDRVDMRAGMPTIVDLKTGAVRTEDLRLASLTRDSITPAKRHALQLLVYVHAYLHRQAAVDQVQACIVPLQRPRHAQGEQLVIDGDPTIHRRMLPAISSLLGDLVNELRDPGLPFRHDPESKYCRYCIA